jgi:glycosyltransferase involved in cell wall biosynthesis
MGERQQMKQSVSIVIFAFNEEKTIAQAIQEAADALIGLGHLFEIIVIDDGSSDDTFTNAREMAGRYGPQVRIIRHKQNLGFGGVFKTGMDAAKNDIFSFIAGDGQPIPEVYYSRCLPPLETHDMVVGKIRNRQDPKLTLFFAWAERLLLLFLFPGVPKIEGPFMFKRVLLDKIDLHYRKQEERGWIIIIELIIRAIREGYSCAIVDVERRPRPVGRSHANNWNNAFRMTWLLFKVWWMIVREK